MIPDVTGLACDRLLDDKGSEYMRRYYIPLTGTGYTRYHHILADDPQRDFHDHPWDFESRLISGTYIEHTPDGVIVYTAPCVIRHRAEDLHRLELPDGPVWSHFSHGRLRRKWGFMTNAGWIASDQYNAGSVAGCGDDNPRRITQRSKPRYGQRRPRW